MITFEIENADLNRKVLRAKENFSAFVIADAHEINSHIGDIQRDLRMALIRQQSAPWRAAIEEIQRGLYDLEAGMLRTFEQRSAIYQLIEKQNELLRDMLGGS